MYVRVRVMIQPTARKYLAFSLSTLSDDTIYNVHSIVFIDSLSRGGKISPRVSAD